jgi:hypothetical protein
MPSEACATAQEQRSPVGQCGIERCRRPRKGALIPNERARSLSSSSELGGELHETQGCPHAPWWRGCLVAA